MYQDIEHYLAEREVDKTRVLYWYHRQFEEVAEARYLADDLPWRIHNNLADYFEGRWSKMLKKPFR